MEGRKRGRVTDRGMAEYRMEPSCVLQDCKDSRTEGVETEETPSLALPPKTESEETYDGCRLTPGGSQRHSPSLHLHL